MVNNIQGLVEKNAELETKNEQLEIENARLLGVIQTWGQRLLYLAEISHNDFRRAYGLKPANEGESNETRHNVFEA